MRWGLLLMIFGLGLAGGGEGLRRSGARGRDSRLLRWATGYRASGVALVIGGVLIEIVGLVLG